MKKTTMPNHMSLCAKKAEIFRVTDEVNISIITFISFAPAIIDIDINQLVK